ncbi:MAG: hypothetical protein HY332_08675 [Chloroflexi bacterium]|nr:hypothetical protein [Chloroflexota bacterium]
MMESKDRPAAIEPTLVLPASAAPEAPTKPAETPTEVPTRPERIPGEKEKESEPDIDEQIKRIIREIPDPTPQPGGE